MPRHSRLRGNLAPAPPYRGEVAAKRRVRALRTAAERLRKSNAKEMERYAAP